MEHASFSDNDGNFIRSIDEYSEALNAVRTPEDVEAVVDIIIGNDSYANMVLEKINSARAAGNSESERHWVKTMADTYRNYQIAVALETGVEIEAIEHEKQKKEYREHISASVKDIDPNSPSEEIMLKLGIITPSEDEISYRFRFPTRLLPPFVNEQWAVYMDMVEQYAG